MSVLQPPIAFNGKQYPITISQAFVPKKRLLVVTSFVLGLHMVVVTGLLHLPTMAVNPTTPSKPAQLITPLAISFVQAQPPVVIPNNHPAIQREPKKTIANSEHKIQPKTESKPTANKAVANIKKPTVNPMAKTVAIQPQANKHRQIKTHQLTQVITKSQPVTLPITEAIPAIVPNVEQPVLQKQTQSIATAGFAQKSKFKSDNVVTNHFPTVERNIQPSKNDAMLQSADDKNPINQQNNQQSKKVSENNINHSLSPVISEPKLVTQKKMQQSPQPMQFGNGDAKWLSRPNTDLSEELSRIIQDENLVRVGLRLNVSETGAITSVSIIQSSGNRQVDNAIRQRIKFAKLQPFIRHGTAVAGVGNVTITLN